MTQPGYGYPTPDGYGMHLSSAALSSDSYQVPANSFATSSSAQPCFPAQGHTSSYGHNKIPGLDLSAPGSSIAGQNSWFSGQAGERNTGLHGPQTSIQRKDALSEYVSKKESGLEGRRDAGSEDGELSDDNEFGDVYDPMDTEKDTATRRPSLRLDKSGLSGPAAMDHQPQEDREHSGSYSPYLSPQEVSPTGSEAVGTKIR